MKEGHITQKENWTYLAPKEEEGSTEGNEETTE